MSKTTTLYKGKFVLVDVVDETIELTVENNVYSRSEGLELIAELEQAQPYLYSREAVEIVVEGGMVVEVNGLPVDWEYHVTDKDIALEGLVDEQMPASALLSSLPKKEW